MSAVDPERRSSNEGASALLASGDGPLLSICIPTYNRKDMVLALVRKLLECPGAFEVRVHDDGSNDGTFDALREIGDDRLRVSSSPNQGRAGALADATASAAGAFIMLFDDDDELWPEGLAQVLEDCRAALPDGVAGYIYHMVDEDGVRIGDEFPRSRSNLLQLRADFGVRGDKKEVARTDLLKPVIGNSRGLGRRVPTSLYWSRIALDFDILCRNVDIGRKSYHQGGMSHGIERLKRASPRPMAALYRMQLKGFSKGRFRSLAAAGRAAAGTLYYWAIGLLRPARSS